MSELPKQLLAWLAKLLPKQRIQGDNAVQVGKVEGDLQNDHSKHKQQLFQDVHSVNLGSSVQNVTQVHQHFYASAQPQQVAPVAPASPARAAATTAHKDVLALMKRLPEPVRIKVLDFMRREFNTAMVIELQPQQVYRVRKYVEVINQQACRQPPQRDGKRVL